MQLCLCFGYMTGMAGGAEHIDRAVGQKGIGFKSVFRITNTPEIHSNNFHIFFDTTSGPIGYILPEWINGSFIDDKISPFELSKLVSMCRSL